MAVDLRRSSPNFGKWADVELSADNKRQLWVSPSFAHGFVVISESAEFLYKTTEYSDPEFKRMLLWCYAIININWPLNEQTKLASKDASGTRIEKAELIN